MSIIKISDELSGIISTFSDKNSLSDQNRLDQLVKENKYFSIIHAHINNVLLKNDYVIVKNIGFNNNLILLESFIKLFGEFYNETIEYATVKTDCNYTACNTGLIELHNDDMILLDNMPKYGFIQVIKEDPLMLSKNGLVKIKDIVSYLEYYNPKLLNDLFTQRIHMMTYGANYNDTNKQWITTYETILHRKNDEINVRFDLGTINNYYWQNKLKQSQEEKNMITEFLDICKKFRKEYYLETSDIIIHNNRKCLHDRTETAIEINSDGSLNTREILVGFTKDN